MPKTTSLLPQKSTEEGKQKKRSQKKRRNFPTTQIKRFIRNQIRDYPKISKKCSDEFRKAMTARIIQLTRDARIVQSHDKKSKQTIMRRHIETSSLLNA